MALLASGGVRDLDDVLALADLGAAGTVVGKALYEGRLDLAKAMETLGRKNAGQEDRSLS
jgi:phosphoribosylformimino-5-aminoimidazole carboxamide ribotide isomerase